MGGCVSNSFTVLRDPIPDDIELSIVECGDACNQITNQCINARNVKQNNHLEASTSNAHKVFDGRPPSQVEDNFGPGLSLMHVDLPPDGSKEPKETLTVVCEGHTSPAPMAAAHKFGTPPTHNEQTMAGSSASILSQADKPHVPSPSDMLNVGTDAQSSPSSHAKTSSTLTVENKAELPKELTTTACTVDGPTMAEDHHGAEASYSCDDEMLITNSGKKDDGNVEPVPTNREVIIALLVMLDIMSLPGLPASTSDDLPQAHMRFARKINAVKQPRDRIQTGRGLCRSISVPDLSTIQATGTETPVNSSIAAATPPPTYAQAVKSFSPTPPTKGCSRTGTIGPMPSLNVSPIVQPAGSYHSDTECSLSPPTTDEDDIMYAKPNISADKHHKKKKRGYTLRPPSFKMRSGLRRPRPLYRVGEEFMT